MRAIRIIKNIICFADLWIIPVGLTIVKHASKDAGLAIPADMIRLITVVLGAVCLYAASINYTAYSHGRRTFRPLGWIHWRSDPYMHPSIPRSEKYPPLPSKIAARKPIGNGIVIGKHGSRYLCLPLIRGKATSTMIVGEPGSGKSVLLLDTLLCQKDPVGMLVVDVKGELSYKGVHLSDPDTVIISPYDRSAFGYDPFYALTEGSTEQDIVDAIKGVVCSLIPVDPKSKDSYWSNSARALFVACALYYYKAGSHNLVDIIDHLVSANIQAIVEEVNGGSASTSTEHKLISQFAGMADETLSGIDSNLKVALTLFVDDQRIRQMLRENPRKADPTMINAGKRLFVKISDRDVEKYATLLHLILNQAISELESRTEDAVPSLIVIDKLARILSAGAIKKLENALETLRSRNVSLLLVTQSLDALQRAYEKSRVDAMLTCCPYKVILSASGKDTIDFVVRSAGKCTVFRDTHGKSGRNSNSSRSTEDKDRVTAVDLIALPELGEAIVISPYGYNRIKKVQYWRDRNLKKIATSVLAANKKYVELREKNENGT